MSDSGCAILRDSNREDRGDCVSSSPPKKETLRLYRRVPRRRMMFFLP
jgi:hypothetical protein